MRWHVEVTPLGKSDGQTQHIEADSWQKALESARARRGEKGSIAGFSIELLADGYRAVDPVARVRYVVRQEKDVQDKSGAADSAKASAAGSSVPGGTGDNAPPRPAETKPSASASAKGTGKPTDSSATSNPTKSVSQPPKSAAPTSKAPAIPKAGARPSASRKGGSKKGTDDAAISPVAARVLGTIDSKIVARRAQEPDGKVPLTYREYAFAVAEGTSEKDAEALLHAKLRLVQQELASASKGKLVNLAVFDVEFEGKPPRPPLATLAWKDWKGPPQIAFPARAGASHPPPQMPSHAPPSLAAKPPSAPPPAASKAPSVAPPAPVMTGSAPPAAATSAVPRPMSSRPPRPDEAAPSVALAAPTEPQLVIAEELHADSDRNAPETDPMPPPSAAQAPVAPAAAQPSVPPPAPVAQAAVQPSAPPPAPVAQAAVQPSAPPPAPVAQAAVQPSAPPPAPVAQAAVQPSDPPPAPSARPASSARLRALHQGKRASPDEIIGDLFEAMHDLHFLRDAIEGGDYCLDLADSVLPSRAGIVHFFDMEQRRFVIGCARGEARSALVGLIEPVEGDTILRAATKGKTAVVFPRVEPADTMSERYDRIASVQSIIAAPVLVSGRLVGVLEIIDPTDAEPFREEEGPCITYIAEQLGEYVSSRGVVVDPQRILAATSR